MKMQEQNRCGCQGSLAAYAARRFAECRDVLDSLPEYPSGDLLKFRPKALALSIVDFMLPAEDRNLQG